MTNALYSYASKLPEKCASINKKFGGGRGTAYTTPVPNKASKGRRTVPKKAATLPRAKSTAPGSRGTTAEPLSLLAAEGILVPKTTRGGTLNSRSFTKKIVEMDNRPVQKKVNEELKRAISALTKPNRIAVASELVDDAEKRLAKTTSRSMFHQRISLCPIASAYFTTEPKKTTNMPAPDVHVAATPKKQKKDLFASSYPELFDASREFLAPNENGASRRLSTSEVMATPPPNRQSRPQAQPFSDDGGVVLATPRRSLFAELKHSAVQQPKVQPRPVPVFETPQKKPPLTPGFWSPCGGVALAEETPLKIPHTPLNVDNRTTEKKQGKTRREPVDSFQENADPGETSIYDALGWDDDALYLA
ncbi:hypothetical protein BDD12DRAFT_419095 [Trichophaea hybrida]|nr:hypothetical protein BDD12DRAFT_419095 [Trichophaea hybrida]